MKALKGTLIALVVLLALALGAVAGGYFWFRQTHIKVNGQVYSLDTHSVDLRGTETSMEEYHALQQTLPNAVIRWDVPFQDSWYPDDTRELTISTLTQEDIQRLDYLPAVSHIDATGCNDYAMLLELEKARPGCQVDFVIRIGNQELERTADTLTLEPDEATAQEVFAVLPFLPNMASITFRNPSFPAENLYILQEQYPNIHISWDKEYRGQTYGMDTAELDFSNIELESLEELENAMSYLPNLKKLILVECGFEYEDLAAYRDRVRDKYKVVWGVHIGKGYLRTDVTSYMPSTMHKQIYDEDTYNLRYCEDLIAVDFGHINVGETSWCVGTPHLKYLILGDGNVFNKHMVPLSCLKELEYLEVFKTPVTDISPLVECTALKDLLLSGSHIDIEPLTQMPWLENLWLLNSSVDAQEAEYLREKLPNTHIEVAGIKHSHSRGWRDLPSYFAMRDAFGMGYMKG